MELMQVLSTKTLNNGAIVLAHSLGMELTCTDFIQISELPINLSSVDTQSYDAVVFTSPNAIKYFFQHELAKILVKGKIIFSLSEKTSSELLKQNQRATYIKKNAADLADAIIKNKKVKSVLHICGNRTLGIIKKKLSSTEITYTPLLVYQTDLQNNVSLNKEFDALLFYSPSGVEGFFAANKPGDKTIFCCIGETTGETLKQYSKNAKILLPEVQSPEAMIKTVGEYLRSDQIAI